MNIYIYSHYHAHTWWWLLTSLVSAFALVHSHSEEILLSTKQFFLSDAGTVGPTLCSFLLCSEAVAHWQKGTSNLSAKAREKPFSSNPGVKLLPLLPTYKYGGIPPPPPPMTFKSLSWKFISLSCKLQYIELCCFKDVTTHYFKEWPATIFFGKHNWHRTVIEKVNVHGINLWFFIKCRQIKKHLEEVKSPKFLSLQRL